MKHNIHLKYQCLDNFEEIYKLCQETSTKKLLQELKELIYYQMEQIRDQRTEIISKKHKNAWTHYDRPLDQYDAEQRKYVDKPPKSDNMSC